MSAASQSEARTEILARIRASIADSPAAPPIPRGYRRRSELTREQIVDMLEDRLDDVARMSGGLKRARAFLVAEDHRPTRLIDRLDLRARLREPADALSVAERSDPAGSVPDLPDRLRAIARSRGPQVAVECDGGGGAAMRPEAFEAAVGHLLDNAIEASPPGAPVRPRRRAPPPR